MPVRRTIFDGNPSTNSSDGTASHKSFTKGFPFVGLDLDPVDAPPAAPLFVCFANAEDVPLFVLE